MRLVLLRRTWLGRDAWLRLRGLLMLGQGSAGEIEVLAWGRGSVWERGTTGVEVVSL